MKISHRLKILFIALISVAFLGIIFLAYALFSFAKETESARDRLIAQNGDLQSELSNLKKSYNEAEDKSYSESISKTMCPSILSSDENSTTSTWKTFKNSAKRYHFMYPSKWSVTGQGDEIVLAFAPSKISMSIRSGSKANVDLSSMNKEKTEQTSVDCQSANKSFYSSDSSKTVATTFEKGNNPFIVTISYDDSGSGDFSGEMINNYNLILKTFAFN